MYIYVYMSWNVIWYLLVKEAAGNEQQLALCDHPLCRNSYTVWYENRWVNFIPFLILVFHICGLSLGYLYSICHKIKRTKMWTDGSQTLMKIFFPESCDILYMLLKPKQKCINCSPKSQVWPIFHEEGGEAQRDELVHSKLLRIIFAELGLKLISRLPYPQPYGFLLLVVLTSILLSLCHRNGASPFCRWWKRCHTKSDCRGSC